MQSKNYVNKKEFKIEVETKLMVVELFIFSVRTIAVCVLFDSTLYISVFALLFNEKHVNYFGRFSTLNRFKVKIGSEANYFNSTSKD